MADIPVLIAFRLYHQNSNSRDNEWRLEQEFGGYPALFQYAPEVAAWFARHTHSSYLEYDHGTGLRWRYQRITEASSNDD